MFKKIKRTFRKFKMLSRLEDDEIQSIKNLNAELDVLRSRIDVGDELFDQFRSERKSTAYGNVYEKESPLISVCVATYNRGRLLVERSLKSILNQDYKNIEVIIVGDCCTDDTAELIAKVQDRRVRFINLPEKGKYPEESMWRWMVAGTTAVNHALSVTTGDFITHLDDDDEYSPDRISKLLSFIRETRADIVFHPFWVENKDGSWYLNNAEQFKKARVTTSSVLYHHWLKRIPWDINAYKYDEPGDWNRFRKIKYLGAKTERHPEPFLKHYKERNQQQA